jgi:hypothetical protein
VRRRLAVAATGLAFLLSGVVAIGATPAKDRRQVIYVRNVSTQLSDAAIRNALPAFQAAVSKDFAPVWNVDARLVFIGKKEAPAGSARVTIEDDAPCFGCYGFHEYVDGHASAEIGLAGNWQITTTHELFEMLADPYPYGSGNGIRGVLVGTTFYALETADPVEADQYTYTRKSKTGRPVTISDFVTPEWFDAASDGPWDFTHAVSRPLQILPGGYQLTYVGGQWQTLEGPV